MHIRKFLLPTLILLVFITNFNQLKSYGLQAGTKLLRSRPAIFNKLAAKEAKEEQLKLTKFLLEMYLLPRPKLQALE